MLGNGLLHHEINLTKLSPHMNFSQLEVLRLSSETSLLVWVVPSRTGQTNDCCQRIWVCQRESHSTKHGRKGGTDTWMERWIGRNQWHQPVSIYYPKFATVSESDCWLLYCKCCESHKLCILWPAVTLIHTSNLYTWLYLYTCAQQDVLVQTSPRETYA